MNQQQAQTVIGQAQQIETANTQISKNVAHCSTYVFKD